MIKTDMIKVMAALAEVYPKFAVTETKTSLYYELLKDLDYPVVQAAVKKHMIISEFPPTIADIRKLSTEIITPDLQITAAEAWGEVMKAIRNYGWYRTEEALASLSEGVRKTTQCIGWQNICEAENLDVIRGQFMKMYGQVEAREKEQALLPENIRETIKQLGEVGKIKLIE